METYVELNLLHQWSVCFFAMMLSASIAQGMFSRRRLLLMVLLSAVCCVDQPWFYGLNLFYEVLCYAYFYAFRFNSYAVYFLIRFTVHLTCLKLFGGLLKGWVYFVSIYHVPWLVWLVLLFLNVLLHVKWGNWFSLHQFVYPCKVGDIAAFGFMDSGNQCEVEGYPVIFVHPVIYENLKDAAVLEGRIHTMANETGMIGKLCEIQVGKGGRTKVVAVSSRDDFGFNCDVLLSGLLLGRVLL